MSEKRGLLSLFSRPDPLKAASATPTLEQDMVQVQPADITLGINPPSYTAAEATHTIIRVGPNNHDMLVKVAEDIINTGGEMSLAVAVRAIKSLELEGVEIIEGVTSAQLSERYTVPAGQVFKSGEGQTFAYQPMGSRVDSQNLLSATASIGMEVVGLTGNSRTMALAGGQEVEIKIFEGLFIEKIEKDKLPEPPVEPQSYIPSVSVDSPMPAAPKTPDVSGNVFLNTPATWDKKDQT